MYIHSNSVVLPELRLTLYKLTGWLASLDLCKPHTRRILSHRIASRDPRVRRWGFGAIRPCRDQFKATLRNFHRFLALQISVGPARLSGAQSPGRFAHKSWSAWTRRTCCVRARVHHTSIFFGLLQDLLSWYRWCVSGAWKPRAFINIGQVLFVPRKN